MQEPYYSFQRVYFVDSEGREHGSRAIDYQYSIGNWGGIAFRFMGKRYKRIPNSFPIKSQRIEVDWPLV